MNLDFIAPLFVPASRPERFEKAAVSGADAVILDLEDAVAPGDRVAARTHLRTDFSSVPVLIRVNGLGTAWHDDDVSAVLSLRPSAVVVPKAEGSPAFVSLVTRLSAVAPVVALIESAVGLAAARSIAAIPGVARLAFGSWDFCADVGCEHVEPALLGARLELVLASRLSNLPPPIDGVTTSIDDSSLIERDARYARSLGFGGKLVIHPRQVRLISTAFEPTDRELEWARKVVASGEAAASVDGAMVDEPIRIRARAMLARWSSKEGKSLP